MPTKTDWKFHCLTCKAQPSYSSLPWKKWRKKLEQGETFGYLSNQDEIHAWMTSEPSQLLLVYTDLHWMLYFLKCFQAIISFSICALLQTLLNLFWSSQVYMSKVNMLLRQNMAVLLFRYILQFSHTSSPYEFSSFSKFSVFNNPAQLRPRKEIPLDSQVCLVLCVQLSTGCYASVVFHFWTLEYQLLNMPDTSNMKFVAFFFWHIEAQQPELRWAKVRSAWTCFDWENARKEDSQQWKGRTGRTVKLSKRHWRARKVKRVEKEKARKMELWRNVCSLCEAVYWKPKLNSDEDKILFFSSKRN